MKLKLQIPGLLIFLSLFIISSCGKDDEVKDPCLDIVCEEGKICKDGVYECPSNYEGDNCETPITPSAVKLTAAIIKNFPVTDPFGFGWDTDSKADISFHIFINANDILYAHDARVEDASPDDDHYFSVSDFKFLDVNANYIIQVLDIDEGNMPDIIGTYTFKAFKADTGFPGLIELRGESTDIDLQVEYLQ